VYDISDYMRRTVYESQILVSYIARYSPIKVDKSITRVLVESNYLIKQNIWGPEQELIFWDAYDKVASSIEPVTLESLKATMSNPLEENKGKKTLWNPEQTDAGRSVTKYRVLTAFALIVLLLAQIYWINGSELTSKLQALFNQIDTISFNIEKRKLDKNYQEIEKDIETNRLIDEKKKLIQEFGATYQLLQDWNVFWQILTFREQFDAKVTNYVQQKYEEDIENIHKKIKSMQNFINSDTIEVREAKLKAVNEMEHEAQKRKFEHEFDKERNKLFLTKISAEFVIRSLQIYALPLLYGLLGSIIYTLRTLASEIKNLTYTKHSETKYKLRITMGLLGGMAIGWFLKPDDLSLAGSLSPMALAFLVGYNVEILFSVMDKFVNVISKFNPEKSANK
jgi:hypothetical protein